MLSVTLSGSVTLRQRTNVVQHFAVGEHATRRGSQCADENSAPRCMALPLHDHSKEGSWLQVQENRLRVDRGANSLLKKWTAKTGNKLTASSLKSQFIWLGKSMHVITPLIGQVIQVTIDGSGQLLYNSKCFGTLRCRPRWMAPPPCRTLSATRCFFFFAEDINADVTRNHMSKTHMIDT